jgi:mRNA-capping enzyme
VTDKADGDRAQVFVTDGKAYLIDNRLNVTIIGTGCDPKLEGTVLDGELISMTQNDLPTRLYAVFDAYAFSGKSVAELPLLGRREMIDSRPKGTDTTETTTLIDTMKLKLKTCVAVGEDGKTIAAMLEETKAAEYHVDGLIFTPAETPVGGRYKTDEVKLKGRWNGAMKWKPPSHNSVDFLVRFKRYNNREGMDV